MTFRMPFALMLLALGLSTAVFSQVLEGPNVPVRVGATFDQSPAVAYDPLRDRYFVVFSDEGFGSRGQFVGSNGELQGEAFAVRPGLPMEGVAFNPIRREFLVLVSNFDGPSLLSEIVGIFFDDEGTRTSEPFRINLGVRFAFDNVDIAFNPLTRRYLVVWGDQAGGCCDLLGQLLDQFGTLVGPPIPISTAPNGQVRPAVAANIATGEFGVVWQDCRERPGAFCRSTGENPKVFARVVGPNGELDAPEQALATVTSFHNDIAYNSSRNEYLIVWRNSEAGASIFVRRMRAEGSLVGERFRVTDQLYGDFQPRVAFDPVSGRYVLVWQIFRDGMPQEFDIAAQLLGADGTPFGKPFDLVTGMGVQRRPAVAVGNGAALAVWSDCRNGPGGVFCDDSDIFGQRLQLTESGTCTPSEAQVCLQRGRFVVEVTWQTPDLREGDGRQVPGVSSPDSALLYFFRPGNWELMVKVLDACTENDRFWVFAAATTNVAYTLTVTDTVSGETREYVNPQGVASAAVTDTQAFATCP